MSKELQFAQNLIDFVYESPSQFHAVQNLRERLTQEGFTEIGERDQWKIEQGGKYFVTKNESALVAFVVGNGAIEEAGFRMVGSHTDAPTFRIKPAPEMVSDGYLKLNTETYGGPILNTWLDRPLALAGRVTLEGENPLYPEMRLVNINRPIMIIPNLAIHMNRKVNEGVELNKQKDMLPMVQVVNDQFEKDNFLLKLIAEDLSIDADQIVDFDLFLYEYEKGSIFGLENEFISCGKLDDLAMVHASIEALIQAPVSEATSVAACFDNEEIGSSTKQGAGSPMLRTILERIVYALGKEREDFFRALYSSFLICADMAHAVHPNMGDKHDPVHKPKLNHGPVVKVSANQLYTTDSDSNTVFESFCKRAEVPVQKFVNRSDQRGGSTIGPISSSQLDIRSLDIGNPMLGMHSVRETGGVKDHYYVWKAFVEFYS